MNESKTILVVEDNEDLRELVCEVLRCGGYAVCEAENGQDALDQLETMRPFPGLLLLDLMMPVMSGTELLQTLSERNWLADLPVVVLSAGGQPGHAEGAMKFLRKPAEPQAILHIVREICGEP